jgi:hypothetical protein
MNLPDFALLTDISPTARYWLEGVLTCLGIPDRQREECIAAASVEIGGVAIMFLQPPYAEKSYLVARAVVGDLPPKGECETLYQLVLEVQGMLCGPHTPVLGLDWPARRLLVSCSLDMPNLGREDAVAILCSMQQMAMQWREAMTQTGDASAIDALQALVRC